MVGRRYAAPLAAVARHRAADPTVGSAAAPRSPRHGRGQSDGLTRLDEKAGMEWGAANKLKAHEDRNDQVTPAHNTWLDPLAGRAEWSRV